MGPPPEDLNLRDFVSCILATEMKINKNNNIISAEQHHIYAKYF